MIAIMFDHNLLTNGCCSSELSLYLNLKSPSKPCGASPSLGTHSQ